MIEFIQVSKRYPSGHEALSQVDLEIKVGEMVFLTGHSGAGKSSLLKLIALIERCSLGKIIVDKVDLSTLTPKEIPWYRRQIGIVFQSPALLSDKNIFDNVALPLVVNGFRYQEIARRVRSALSMVGLLDKWSQHPAALSCGEQQRVGIARAVVHKPKILLADEPTGNLDPALAREIMQLFANFNQAGVTTLIASHDMALIQRLQYRVIGLQQGKLSHGEQASVE